MTKLKTKCPGCGQRMQATCDRAGYLPPPASPRAAARRKFATLITDLLFRLLVKKEKEPNCTAVAKIAHAGINRQGYNERTGVIRF